MAEKDFGDTSERYEFDAPSEVVDLKELDNNADSEDLWFGECLMWALSVYRSKQQLFV